MSDNIPIQVPQPQPATNASTQPVEQSRLAPYRHSNTMRYMECMKNHATSIGRHGTDGCGEFMAGGIEGTIEALICCVCNCHRNFHVRVAFEPCANPFCCIPPQDLSRRRNGPAQSLPRNRMRN